MKDNTRIFYECNKNGIKVIINLSENTYSKFKNEGIMKKYGDRYNNFAESGYSFRF